MCIMTKNPPFLLWPTVYLRIPGHAKARTVGHLHRADEVTVRWKTGGPLCRRRENRGGMQEHWVFEGGGGERREGKGEKSEYGITENMRE